MTKLYYESFDTIQGKLTIIAREDRVIRIDFGSLPDVQEKAKAWFKKYFNDPEFKEKSNLTKKAKKQLEAYFAKERRRFSLPIELYGTAFQIQVWTTIEKELPYGKVWTYKRVGQAIENVKAVRAIGGALNKNPISIVVPCHRVIGSSGKLVGYGGGLDKKEFLLDLEN